MTEDEAKTKWCPHVRSVPAERDGKEGWGIPTGIPAHNRLAGTALVGRCIASTCMAWRWETIASGPMMGEPSSRGYCGLAGSPS